MEMFGIASLHGLHVLAGAVWAGAYIFHIAVIWPTLLRHPPAQAQAWFAATAPRVGALMAVSGSLTLLLGLLRGTWLGPVRSFDILFTTAYGRTFLAAALLTLFAMVYGKRTGQGMPQRLWEGDRLRADAVATVRRSSAISLLVLAAIFACMVLMRFGL